MLMKLKAIKIYSSIIRTDLHSIRLAYEFYRFAKRNSFKQPEIHRYKLEVIHHGYIKIVEDRTLICYHMYDISLEMNGSLQIRSSSCAVSRRKTEENWKDSYKSTTQQTDKEIKAISCHLKSSFLPQWKDWQLV
ncbi:unnamed protein product [Rotaria socialis]|uniref:Uncharacterized protein n=1 Tax=Rotaria socialis TaxID=392032 RepID=A0A818B0C5_9BILA|nr:unnamed protein product [Rotaria socialis]CAF4508484.1 unnamed protein product [Rotaria socialis]